LRDNALAQRPRPAGVAFAQAKDMTAGLGPIGAVCYAADSCSTFHPGKTSTAG